MDRCLRRQTTAQADDWRRIGQQRILPPGTVLIHRRYKAPSASWEHDHCEFCSAKFMEHASSAEPFLTEGFTTTAEHDHGAGYHWVCADCAADFADEFGWVLVAA